MLLQRQTQAQTQLEWESVAWDSDAITTAFIFEFQISV